MRDELIAAFGRADADDEVRAVIVTGAGRAFCAGADLSGGGSTFDYAKRDDAGQEDQRDGGGRVSLSIFALKKPVIAAINGAAVGVGATMTLPMDIRIASSAAKFGFVFARRGIVPEACSAGSCRKWSASAAPRNGSIRGACSAPTRRSRAGSCHGWSRRAISCPRHWRSPARSRTNTSAVAVALARQMLWRMAGADHPMEAHKVDSRGIFAMGASPDVKEGIAAFLEKRAPQFPMKPSSDMPSFYPWWEDRPFK
jgi:enoyl-CoA hydratase/carnithine racemase